MSVVTQKIKLGLGPIKRKRDPVFTNNEKRLLIDLVEEHFSVIECKKTDGVTSRAKYTKWGEIACSFNAQSEYIERDVPNLRNLWDNLKKKAKATITILNGNRYATGGGPGKEPKEDPNIDRVISLIKTNVEGFSNIYDSDSVPTQTLDYGSTAENVNFELEISEDKHDYAMDLESEIINGDCSHYTPAMLRTPRAKVLIEGRPTFKVSEDNFVEAEIFEIPFDETNKTSRPVTPKSSLEDQKAKITVKTQQNLPTKSSRHKTNRRRPVLKESEAVAPATTKINTLKSTTEQAKQRHEVVMRCLYLQEEQEKEKLKQEQEKTEQEVIKKKILLAELNKVNGNLIKCKCKNKIP